MPGTEGVLERALLPLGQVSAEAYGAWNQMNKVFEPPVSAERTQRAAEVCCVMTPGSPGLHQNQQYTDQLRCSAF